MDIDKAIETSDRLIAQYDELEKELKQYEDDMEFLFNYFDEMVDEFDRNARLHPIG